MAPAQKLPAALAAVVMGVLIWSAINPYDYFTLLAEIFPVLIALPLLFLTRDKFRLTPLCYILIAIHCCILIYGGHTSYAQTPLGNWMRDALHLDRNPYDRLGHLAQGFIPAIIIRELLVRTSPLKPGKWLFAIIVFCCFGISAVYELVEWAAAVTTGAHAEAFLGTQGDVWDTQKDMLCAGIGAILALLTLSPLHDGQLRKVAGTR